MLITLFTIWALTVFGGGDSGLLPKDFYKQADKLITEDSRKDEVKTLKKQVEKGVKFHNKELETLAKVALTLNKNYETTEGELQSVVDEILAERTRGQMNIIDARMKLKELITRDEWNAIVDAIEEDD